MRKLVKIGNLWFVECRCDLHSTLQRLPRPKGSLCKFCIKPK